MIRRADTASPVITMQIQERLSGILDYLLPTSAGLVALIVYVITMAPDLTWAHFGSDGGELITASMTSGIPHPPGYPTYVLLGKLFALFPAGTVAWRFNLMSAVFAAVAVFFSSATALNTLEGKRHRETVSLAAGLTVAFAPLLWSQALIAEVYPLNIACLAIFLWSVLGNRSPILSGLFVGLAVTTHLSSLIMLPLAFVLVQRSSWKQLVAGLAIGLIPLLLLPLLVNSASPVIWGNPTTLTGWWWLVSGRLYYANLGLPESGDISARAVFMGGLLLKQLAYAGWLFVILGISARILNKRATIALLATSLLYVFYGYLYQTDDAIVNFLPVLLLLSPLLAAGLARIGLWSLLIPVALLLINFQALNLHNENDVRPLAADVLTEAPENSVLLTTGDQSIFSLWYFHHVEDIRPDLTLVDANLLAFDWYRQRLSEQYPDLSGLEKDDVDTFRMVNGRTRPICDVASSLNGITGCTPAP